MHFQVPPHAHQKIVYCITGKVLDVILDLRTASPTFGQSAVFELSAENRHVLYLPVGIAHGFLSLEDDSCLVYKTDAVHSADCDRGIRWDSFGFEWPVIPGIPPSISDRDSQQPGFQDFTSPF
jgi:dTDP-4-dehydrorhamnose 3,5-epimerase